MTRILVLIGSLRAASVNRQIAELAVEVSPKDVTMTVFEGLGELPFYNEDIDTDDVAEAVKVLRRECDHTDAVLVVTPEYNATIPGVLKNAIDWLSRPYGKGALKGKPLAVIGASMGSFGGTWAHDETRKSFAIAGLRVADWIQLSIPLSRLNGVHPREHAETAEMLSAVVRHLAAEAR